VLVKNWQIKESKLVVDEKWMRVRKDMCILATGEEISYYLWLGDDFSMVFALTQEDHVVLVKQYRHGVQDVVLELPAGVVDPTDLDPLTAAARELREETGFDAVGYEPLGRVFLASSKAPTVGHFYLATGLAHAAEADPDVQEAIECLTVPVSKLIHMIDEGEIRDVNTIAATFLALRRLGRVTIGPSGE
jgi:8-oxo-dGTP pyrophosphatase MutT (NUDIX family)